MSLEPVTPRVLVMMATFNGEQYLSEQIDSILGQEGVLVALHICDDCSTDATMEICERYASAHEGIRASRNPHNLGYTQNFMQMIYDSESRGFDYYAFADQDDIWESNKLLLAVREIAAIERVRGGATPVLYYSDALNFDDEHEWSEVARYAPCEDHPDTLLVRNWILGCTMVFNRGLFELLAQYRPDSFPRIHDAWVHCVARYCGEVVADFAHAPIRHRITGKNAIGAPKDHASSLKAALKGVAALLRRPEATPTTCARMLVLHYAGAMTDRTQEKLEAFANYRRSLVSRLRFVRRFDFYQPTWQGRALVRLCFLLGRY